MFETKAFLVSALKADAALVAALGGTDKIVEEFPDEISSLPLLSYNEENNANQAFADNAPFADRVEVKIDIWQDRQIGTTPIAKLVDNVMQSLLYTRELSLTIAEPNTNIAHRVMRYSRAFVAADFV